MRSLLLALLLISSATHTLAARNHLKTTDFEPLTSLPWKKPDAKLETVLDAIFREPNQAIRYPVLAEYLRSIPVGQLGKAFDICITLEDTQTPDNLVEFFLPIWAKRDPKGCWKRTKELFHLVGIEEGWLGYDSWKDRSRITVQDIEAIRASPFWITSGPLIAFPLGVDASPLPKQERVRIMKEFSTQWFDRFKSWPGDDRASGNWKYPADARELVGIFDRSLSSLRNYASESHPISDETAFEVALRRWLLAEPAAAQEIVNKARKTKWPPRTGETQPRSAGPSTELLMIWAKADLPAMIRWAESLDIRKDDVAFEARQFLMSRVDQATRKRWLADAKAEGPAEDRTVGLLDGWAAWDPKPALDAAVAINDAETLEDVVSATVDGPWHLGAFNTWHSGLDVIKDFDVTKLQKEIRHAIRSNWGQFVMEAWGEIDVGAAARHGLDFMLSTDYAPRDRLMKFFSGHDEYPDEGGMIDRTFCALRVWAVVKPDEMKAWIATQKDAEMRKALTWLLQHPWGTGPKE